VRDESYSTDNPRACSDSVASAVFSLRRPEVSLILLSPLKAAYGLLSFQYPDYLEASISTVAKFRSIYFQFSHSISPPAADHDFWALIRSCMRYNHHCKYGVLFDPARLKSEAVRKPTLCVK
jgi:hypothetical protein